MDEEPDRVWIEERSKDKRTKCILLPSSFSEFRFVPVSLPAKPFIGVDAQHKKYKEIRALTKETVQKPVVCMF